MARANEIQSETAIDVADYFAGSAERFFRVVHLNLVGHADIVLHTNLLCRPGFAPPGSEFVLSGIIVISL